MSCRVRADRALLLDINGRPVKQVGLQELLEMVNNGEAVRISRPKAPKTVGKLTKPRTADRTRNMTSISFREMQANVLPGPGTHRARLKVAAWPHVGDTRAVRVGPRTLILR